MNLKYNKIPKSTVVTVVSLTFFLKIQGNFTRLCYSVQKEKGALSRDALKQGPGDSSLHPTHFRYAPCP